LHPPTEKHNREALAETIYLVLRNGRGGGFLGKPGEQSGSMPGSTFASETKVPEGLQLLDSMAHLSLTRSMI
jgi:hypothetical protein